MSGTGAGPGPESKFAGSVARNSVELMNVVGTAESGFPATTVLVLKNPVPAKYTSCCTDPSPTVLGDIEVKTGSTDETTVRLAVPDSEGSAAETAVMVTAPGAALTGAKYSPGVHDAGKDVLGQIKPSVWVPPATPATSQVTFVPAAVPPFTLARNCWCSPVATVAVDGVMVTCVPEMTLTTAVPNAVELMVLVATTKNPFVGGSVAGAVYMPPGVEFAPVVIIPYPTGNCVWPRPNTAGLQTVG